jgi:hypothetical protein
MEPRKKEKKQDIEVIDLELNDRAGKFCFNLLIQRNVIR